MINVKEIKIKDLIPFEDSPFEFREDEGFTQLFDSISESGVFSPIVVRERDGKFEIVKGLILMLSLQSSKSLQEKKLSSCMLIPIFSVTRFCRAKRLTVTK